MRKNLFEKMGKEKMRFLSRAKRKHLFYCSKFKEKKSILTRQSY